MICKRCEGSGNELLFWFKRCRRCSGTGRLHPLRLVLLGALMLGITCIPLAGELVGTTSTIDQVLPLSVDKDGVLTRSTYYYHGWVYLTGNQPTVETRWAMAGATGKLFDGP